MQAQQLYNENRKIKHELNVKTEELEDLRDELREMTQMYLMMKQDRDKCRSQIESVKGDLNNIDKIIKDNVEKATRNKEKQIQEMNMRAKEQNERIIEIEKHKKCYLDTITYLETQLSKVSDDLEKERALNVTLMENKENQYNEQMNLRGSYQFGKGILNDEKAKLKQLQIDDDILTSGDHKIKISNQNNMNTYGIDKDVTTTHGDDYEEEFTYDEQTNCRLRGMTSDSDLTGALFSNNGFGTSSVAAVKLNEVKLEIKSGSKSEKKVRSKNTPAKVAPFDDQM